MCFVGMGLWIRLAVCILQGNTKFIQACDIQYLSTIWSMSRTVLFGHNIIDLFLNLICSHHNAELIWRVMIWKFLSHISLRGTRVLSMSVIIFTFPRNKNLLRHRYKKEAWTLIGLSLLRKTAFAFWFSFRWGLFITSLPDIEKIALEAVRHLISSARQSSALTQGGHQRSCGYFAHWHFRSILNNAICCIRHIRLVGGYYRIISRIHVFILGEDYAMNCSPTSDEPKIIFKFLLIMVTAYILGTSSITFKQYVP